MWNVHVGVCLLACLCVMDGWSQEGQTQRMNEIQSMWIYDPNECVVVVVYRYTVSMVTARNANAWCFCEAGRMQREMGL